MATVIKSIKASGGDYATIQAWADDLDNAGVYGSGDDAIGELYNEEYSIGTAVTIALGSGIPLNSVTLRAEASNKHTGTAGTGARVKLTSTVRAFVLSRAVALEDIEINCNGTGTPTTGSIIAASVDGCNLRRLIVHDWTASSNSSSTRSLFTTSAGAMHMMNCIVYNCTLTNTSSGSLVGYIDSTTGAQRVCNNTFYNFILNGGSGNCQGINVAGAGVFVQNNIVLDMAGTTSGTKSCYVYSSTTGSQVGNNMSSDLTADDGGGSNCITSAVAADQFVSISPGTENLKLASGSVSAVGAGLDLVTTPTGVNLDILGRDRDAEADVWDMGAHEFVVVVGGSTSLRVRGSRMRMGVGT